jgi:hypothetical protein
MPRRTISPVLATALLMVGITWAVPDEPALSAILTSSRSRAAYLAHATMWKDPGDLSSDEILAGPSDVFPYSAAEALEGIGCTFLKPGVELGGKSAKFLCATSDGRTLRPKYWDPERETGNREVFAIVAATRLMWALGFEVLHALPINVRCDGCPSNPMTGEGARSARDYVAELSVYPPSGPRILSRDDRDQGWSWRELDDAISALPPGPERTRQRLHFDALALLGVFLQHGDRKPEQQVLYCDAPVDMAAGKRQTSKAGDMAAILLERPDSSSCPKAAAVIVDVGATFGGAGHTSSDETAKMNLDAWQGKTVFKPDHDGTCRGRLTVSLAAGRDGEGDPEISEEGRRFLLQQLHRLSPAHVRAIFAAARVDQLRRPRVAAGIGAGLSAIDEWVTAFDDKVRQIEARQCHPAVSGRIGR